MSRLALSLLSLLIGSKSESWSCGRTCGPCQIPGEICNLQCLGYEACKEGTLTCSASNGRTDLCTIDCRAEKACLTATIQATTVYTELSVNCLMAGSCEELSIYAAQGADVFINCDAANSCTNLYLAAFDSRDVFVNCVGEGSCEGARIECGTGSCLMNCLNNLGGVCSGIHLGCGSSPRCQINCRGNQKCDAMTINTVGTIGFQCIGDAATECVGAPAPFMLPTKPPTNFPTKNPTAAPTLSPTGIPTKQPTRSPSPAPTGNPTEFPSPAPTLSPTSYPTDSPTFRPTTDPSKSPTMKPTVNPTPAPTLNPTASPTFSPTLSPTTSTPSVYPTNNPSASPITLSPTNNPTLFPSSSPTIEDQVIYNTAIDNRNNAVDGSGNTVGLVNGLGSNQTEGYLILICILIAVCICCCVPLFCLVYRKVGKNNHSILHFDKSKNDDDDDDDEDDHDDDEMPSPAPPLRDCEGGDFVPNAGKLQRLQSKSITKDGFSSQFGFASNSVTTPFAMTGNSRSSRRSKKPEQSVEELEYGDHGMVNPQSNYMNDAEMTQNIVKVSIWFIENVKLPQYCELFVLNGFTSMESVQSIQEMSQLEMLGIERADHRYQILREINLLGPQPNPMSSDSDDILQDGMLQTGASKPLNRPPPPAPSATSSYSKKVTKKKGRSKKRRDLTRDGAIEMVGPEETHGIPPEFADRVKVVQDRNGDQVWHIKDVMERDLVSNHKRSRQSKQSEPNKIKNRVRVDHGSQDSEDDLESTPEISTFGQENQSISDSSLFRAFKNNLVQ